MGARIMDYRGGRQLAAEESLDYREVIKVAEQEIGEETRRAAQHWEQRVRNASKRERALRALLAAALLTVFGASCLYDGLKVRALGEAGQLSRTEVAASADLYLYIVSSQLEAYREQHGGYPASLEALEELQQPGLDYVPFSNGSYRLSCSMGGMLRSYDSREAASHLLHEGVLKTPRLPAIAKPSAALFR
jgi:hypothetical protein